MSIYGKTFDGESIVETVNMPRAGTYTYNTSTTYEIVIEAKAVKNNVISCKKIDEKIVIITNNEKDEKYTFEIVKDSEFWNQNNIIFKVILISVIMSQI